MIYSLFSRLSSFFLDQEVLDKVKADAVAKLEVYKNFMADSNNAKYSSGLTAINQAIADIKKATTEERVKDILDKALRGIDETVEEAITQFEEARADALADLQDYVDTLSKMSGLTQADKDRVQSLVEEAKAEVNVANSEIGVGTAMSEFEGLMKTGFKDVVLTKAINDAVETLTSFKADAKAETKTYLDEEIAKIKEMDDVDKIKAEVKEIRNAVDQQGLAYERLQEYRDYVAANVTNSKQKQLINGQIDTTMEAVAKAKVDTEVNAAMKAFENFMKQEQYESINDAVELKIEKDKLTETYNEAISKLAEYLNSSNADVKKLAQQGKASIEKEYNDNKNATVKTTVTTAITSIEKLVNGTGKFSTYAVYDDSVNASAKTRKENDKNFAGYVKSLKKLVNDAKDLEVADKQKRDSALAAAEETLKSYEALLKDPNAVKELELDATAVSRIQGLIDATRESINNADTKSKIDDAMTLLNAALNNYYGEYAETASKKDFDTTKTAAKETIAELKTKYNGNETIKDAIDEAGSAIEDAKYPTKKASDIRSELDKINKIIELEVAKQEAVATYTELLATTQDSGLKTEITTLIANISALKYDGKNNFKTPDDVQAIMDAASVAIKEKVAELEATKSTELRELKTAKLEYIDKYIDIETAVGSSAILSQLRNYRSAVDTATTEADVNSLMGEFENYLTQSCAVLKEKYETIYDETEGLSVKYKEYYSDTELKALVDDAIKAVKEVSEDSNATKAIEKIVSDLTTSKTGTAEKIVDAIKAVKSKAQAAISEINAKIENKDIEEQLKLAVQQYIDKINAVTRADVNYEDTITGHKTDALNVIEAMLEQKIAAELETKATWEGNIEVTVNDDGTLSVKAEKLEVTDNIVIEEGMQLEISGSFKIENEKTITISKGASLTLDDSINAYELLKNKENEVIVNNGKLTLYAWSDNGNGEAFMWAFSKEGITDNSHDCHIYVGKSE